MGALSQAYLAADYAVLAQAPFTLHVGVASAQVLALHRAHGCEQSIYMSACNPRSRRLRPAANRRRMQALHRILQRDHWPWLPAEARDPAGHWPVEASVWIPGMTARQATPIARQFGQNAFVVVDSTGIPVLQWITSAVTLYSINGIHDAHTL